MIVDINKKYFIVVAYCQSLNKVISEEGIDQRKDADAYISRKDGSVWTNRFSDYDYVHEFDGIMRLPELNFEELWFLLLFSKIEYNRIGALLIIEELYGEYLLKELLNILNSNNKISRAQKKTLKFIKSYSLPNGAFHWKRNKNLNQFERIKTQKIWDEIDLIVNKMLPKKRFIFF